jgi:hypothetical protein
MTWTSTACAALALTLAAAAPALAQQDPDSRELAAYRLTTDGLAKYAATMRALVPELQKDPRYQELQRIHVEIRQLEDKEDLTRADERRLDRLYARQEELEDAFDGLDLGEAATLTEMEANLRGFPPMAHALRAAGFAPRDFAKFMLVLTQAGLTYAMQQQGLLDRIPDGVAVENIRFVERHAAEIERLTAEFATLFPD